jgi:uncharacterized membrane protein
MEIIIYLFIRYSPIAYVIGFFVKIYRLHQKKKDVPDVLVKLNLVIISAFAFFYYYLMPVKGFLFWGSVAPPDDYGGAIANAVVTMINYGATFLVFCLSQGIFFLIVRARNGK